MGITAFFAERDWTGLLAIIWVCGYFLLLGWTVYIWDIEFFREIIVALSAPTVLLLKYYYDRQDPPK